MRKERQTGLEKKKPLTMMAEALKDAKNAKEPESDTFRADLLRKLDLDTPEQDGLTLYRRATREGTSIGNLRRAVMVVKGVNSLLDAGLEDKTNPQQEELGRDLCAVAASQFEREGAICAMVTDMVLSAPERYLEEFPGIKVRVYKKEVEQRVEEAGGVFDDAEIFSNSILSTLGVIYSKKPSEPILIEDQPGHMRQLTISKEPSSEKEKNTAIIKSLHVLPAFWVKRQDDVTHHPLIPRDSR